MSKWRLFFSVILSLICCLISGSKVFAQSETPEPTPTFEPIYKTQTPFPTDYYDCPEYGEMGGYGEVTPDASWMLRCGLCLSTQQYAENTSTPIPTLEGTPGTPAVTLTPTPMATPTATPQQFQPGIYEIICSGAEDCNTQDHMEWNEANLYGLDHYKLESKYGYFQVDIEGEAFYQGGGSGTAAHDCKVRLCWNDCNNWTQHWEGVQHGSGNYQITVDVYQNQGSAGDEGWVWVRCNSPQPHNFDYQVSGFKIVEVRGYDVMVLENTEFVPDPTPTPMATQEDNSYCSEISSNEIGESDGFDAEGIFTIPVPYLGSATCQVLLPEFTIPTTAINIIPGINIENDLYFPGITFCARVIHFGVLTILNMNVDLDFYAVLIGSMMILRKILRS